MGVRDSCRDGLQPELLRPLVPLVQRMRLAQPMRLDNELIFHEKRKRNSTRKSLSIYSEQTPPPYFFNFFSYSQIDNIAPAYAKSKTRQKSILFNSLQVQGERVLSFARFSEFCGDYALSNEWKRISAHSLERGQRIVLEISVFDTSTICLASNFSFLISSFIWKF